MRRDSSGPRFSRGQGTLEYTVFAMLILSIFAFVLVQVFAPRVLSIFS